MLFAAAASAACSRPPTACAATAPSRSADRARSELTQFGQPTLYAGDFQRGEQRLFQLGARFEF